MSLSTVVLGKLRTRRESLTLLQQLLVLMVQVLVREIGGGPHVEVPPVVALAGVGGLVRGLGV